MINWLFDQASNDRINSIFGNIFEKPTQMSYQDTWNQGLMGENPAAYFSGLPVDQQGQAHQWLKDKLSQNNLGGYEGALAALFTPQVGSGSSEYRLPDAASTYLQQALIEALRGGGQG